MLPFFKVLKGLIDIDVSHFVDFYANCDYYSFSYHDHLAPVVQTVDNAIHRINHYPFDILIGFAITYQADGDLSGG